MFQLSVSGRIAIYLTLTLVWRQLEWEANRNRVFLVVGQDQSLTKRNLLKVFTTMNSHDRYNTRFNVYLEIGDIVLHRVSEC